MENNRLKRIILACCYIYILAFFLFFAGGLYAGLYDFYHDYNEYCTYVSKTENYHFLIEGKQGCKIKWNNFLGLHAYYIVMFLIVNFVVSIPAVIVVKKTKKSLLLS